MGPRQTGCVCWPTLVMALLIATNPSSVCQWTHQESPCPGRLRKWVRREGGREGGSEEGGREGGREEGRREGECISEEGWEGDVEREQ